VVAKQELTSIAARASDASDFGDAIGEGGQLRVFGPRTGLPGRLRSIADAMSSAPARGTSRSSAVSPTSHRGAPRDAEEGRKLILAARERLSAVTWRTCSIARAARSSSPPIRLLSPPKRVEDLVDFIVARISITSGSSTI